jgi:MFS-type transporter involved in bile tolerance (Atg22 family)
MVPIMVLVPLFLGLAVVPYQAVLPDNVVPEQRATVSGVNLLLGMAGGMLLLGAARLWWEARPAAVFWLVAGALALGFAITLAAVREPPVPASEAAEATEPDGGFAAYFRGVLQYREAAKYVACYFFFWVGIGGVTPFVTRFGHEELGITPGDTFLLLLAVLLGTLLFSAPAGWLGDHFGKQRVTSWGLLAFAILILAGSQSRGMEQALPLLALAGLAQAVPSVLAYPLFTELVPARRMGELTGLSTMIWSLAQPLGATVFGAMADQVGTLRAVLVGGGLALLVAWAILQSVRVPPAPAPRADADPADAAC